MERRRRRGHPHAAVRHLAQHPELCFGCGQANIFGLQLELDETGPGAASGRFFVKQDHQGADGSAHPGVLAAALADAMARCAGTTAPPRRLELDFDASAPVGEFVQVDAHVERAGAGTVEAVAHADGGDGRVASARALYAA